ncbi:MAG TPA: DMT family transporter [Ramlibacter sp.]|nr:DMT family transporter [Ramlibacter sp.]
MTRTRLAALTAITMIAFAANSWLCRLALSRTSIDAATFTTARLVSGAAVLVLLAARAGRERSPNGNWVSAAALFAYAAAFSFAYHSLTAGTGALILFGSVQATMILWDLRSGSGLRPMQLAGLVLALAGLVGLVLPGLAAPPLGGSLLMTASGIAWGVYSMRGRGAGNPVRVTAGNFARAVPFALVLTAATLAEARPDADGLLYAVASGAITSGIGYAIWYSVLPSLKATSAATVQLSVPVIAALGGIAFMGEAVTLRLVLASLAILGGIALVISDRASAQAASRRTQ